MIDSSRNLWIAYVGLFLVSLMAPAINVIPTTENAIHFYPGVAGWECLLFGPMMGHLAAVAWFANWTSLHSMRALHRGRNKQSVIFALLSLTLAQASWLTIGEQVRVGPGGTTEIVVGMGLGFYTWLCFMLVPVFGAYSRKQKFGSRPLSFPSEK